MDSATWNRLTDLFSRALELPPGERTAFLEQECGDDDDLRAEAVAMVAAGDESSVAPGIERKLLGGGERPTGPAAPAPGARVGAWRLERLLGRGGMGEVWLAERADGGFEQRAAVKQVWTGGLAPGLVARARRERQLLARLVHPNIATLLDGGVTESGYPFFAMEYVEGQPITTWCEQRNVTVTGRLELFRTVCEAVHFAHVNLIVHRDLKPANILVTADGRPVLLDFGIAKLVTAETGETAAGEDRVLTPDSAAPEQIRGGPITTATDVWGLGLLLFELLASRRPYDLRGADEHEIERVVCDEPIPRPSEVATAPEVRRALRGDLDEIVAKALRKNPTDRYPSVEGLAADVDRHLSGFPITARADRFAYRAAKFLRRNRWSSLAAAAFGVLVVLFAAFSWRQARVVTRERDTAMTARESAEEVTEALIDLLRVADPRRTPGADTLRVADLLRLGEERLPELDADPLARARLWETFADLHAARSRLREERAALEEARAAAREAAEPEVLLRIEHARALNVAQLEGEGAARPLLRESLAAHERVYGPEDPTVAVALQDLAHLVDDAAERQRLLERAREITAARFPERSVEVAAAWNSLGTHHWRAGAAGAAADAFTRSLGALEGVLSPEHPDVLTVRQNVATCRQLSGDFAGAELELREVLAVRRRVIGPETQDVATALQNLGVVLAHRGRHEESAECLAEVLRIVRAIYGEAHVRTWRAKYDSGIALAYAGRPEEGFARADSAIANLDESVGPEATPTCEYLASRLAAELRVGRSVDPGLVRSVLRDLSAQHPEGHLSVSSAHATLGAALLASDSEQAAADALSHFREALSGYSPFYGEGHPLPAHVRCGLEAARGAAGHPVDREVLASALAGCEEWGLAQPVVLERARAALAAATAAASR